MENILTTLPQKLSPQAMAAGAPEGLRVGRHISHAAELFKVFSEDDISKVNLLRKMASEKDYTLPMFEEDIKQWIKLAADADVLMGWTAPEGAKGREKYGPKQSTQVQRATEARQIFGVLRMDPKVLLDMGYLQALEASRKYLRDNNVNYRGEAKPDEKSREIRRNQKATNQALDDAKEANPIQPGENMLQYSQRIAKIAEENFEQNQRKAFEEDVTKAAKRLIENNSVAFVDALALTILAQSDPDGIRAHIATLTELLQRKEAQEG